jgi:hypothetical protein
MVHLALVEDPLQQKTLPEPWDIVSMVSLVVTFNRHGWTNLTLPENAGPVSEFAFCNCPTKTLIATHSVIYVPDGLAPSIFSTYFDDATTRDPDFWPKSVVQSLFLPLDTNRPKWHVSWLRSTQRTIGTSPVTSNIC